MKKRRKKLLNRDLILHKLAELGSITAENLLNTVYNLPAVFSKTHGMRWRPKIKFSFDVKSKLAWHSMLSKLKKEKLIYKSQDGKLKITKMGRNYLKNHLPWSKHYQALKNKNATEIILVIFDVPEHMRDKRDWLRFHLRNMNFMPLQRSVWYGNNILPENFIEDLKFYNLFFHVHILSVVKKGSTSEWLDRIGRRDLAS